MKFEVTQNLKPRGSAKRFKLNFLICRRWVSDFMQKVIQISDTRHEIKNMQKDDLNQ